MPKGLRQDVHQPIERSFRNRRATHHGGFTNSKLPEQATSTVRLTQIKADWPCQGREPSEAHHLHRLPGTKNKGMSGQLAQTGSDKVVIRKAASSCTSAVMFNMYVACKPIKWMVYTLCVTIADQSDIHTRINMTYTVILYPRVLENTHQGKGLH